MITLAEVHKQVTKAGYKQWTPTYNLNAPNGWYSYDDLFLFGDYRGSDVQQANIEAVRAIMKKHPSAYLYDVGGEADEEYIVEGMNDGVSMVIIMRLSYWTDKVIFNMPRIAEKDPDFYDNLIRTAESYPLLDDDIYDKVVEERMKGAWYDLECEDVLQIVYAELFGEGVFTEEMMGNYTPEYTDWKRAVIEAYAKGDLLDIFLSCDDDGGGDGIDYVYHETGRSMFFKKYENDDKYTPPMLRMIRTLKGVTVNNVKG